MREYVHVDVDDGVAVSLTKRISLRSTVAYICTCA